jgi:hypothetical protein
MNGLPRHPGTEEIAEFRAGVTDATRGDLVAAHLAECLDCSSVSARLERLPLMLASIPPPALPASVEARVMAALAAESEARSGPVFVSPSSPSFSATGRRAWPRQRLAAPLGVLVAAAVCLVAFIGLRLSGQGHPGGAPAAGGSPVPARGHASAGAVAGPRQNSISPALRQHESFPVLVSSANFQNSTLQAQVRHQLAAVSVGGDRISPSKSLVGCVTRLASGSRLALVEEASYQSQPAYVIVTPARAWVVARRCTAADPAVLASVALSAGR